MGIVVLGTGRSGTSAITRAFVSAGFFAGRQDDLLGPSSSNPLGHYEPVSVLRINQELMERFECSWWSDLPAAEEQIAQRDEIVPRLTRVLDSLIASAEGAPVAVKEPRINSLLPLWQPVIDGVLHPVLAVRDPLEIAMSHSDRDGTSVGHALAAWETQMTLVLDWLDGRVVTVAPFAKLVARPDLAIDLVRDATLHLDPSRTDLIRPEDSAAALQPDLRHHSGEDLPRIEYLTGRQAELWGFLEALGAGNVPLEVPPDLRAPSAAALGATRKESERIRFATEHGIVCAQLSAANGRVAELEQALANTSRALAEAEARHAREIAGIEASVSWRLTSPLRRLAALTRRSSA